MGINYLNQPFTCFIVQIREDIHHHGINIYPAAYGAEDEEDAAINEKIDVSPLETVVLWLDVDDSIIRRNSMGPHLMSGCCSNRGL